MTKGPRIACAAAAAGAVCVAFYACSSVERVDAQEFTRALQRGQRDSAQAFTPIGVAGKRAYLEHWSIVPVIGERVTVMWTPVEELPPEVVERVKVRE